MEESGSVSNMVSFPVIIHQTKNAYYIKVGDDKSTPQDFQIILEDGNLTIASAKNPSIKAKAKAEHMFLHTANGKNVKPPSIRKRIFSGKGKFNRIVKQSLNTVKSLLLTL